MDAKTLLTKAKAKLILGAPFYASMALRLPFVEDPTCETAWTDGKRIGYNPRFIESLTLDGVVGTICHEVMHITNLHHLRRNNRKPKKWNMACDYAINPIIKNCGYSLPEGALLDPAFNDTYAEKIYNMLPEPQDGDNNGNDPGGCGEVRDMPGQNGAPSPAEIKQAEAEAKVMIAQAKNIAKAQGKLPGDLERMIDEILAPQVNWKEVLAAFLTESAKNDYTWTKPNRRYVHSGIYLPALESTTLGEIILLVDTSGSISQKEINLLISEIKGILSAFPNIELTLIWVDAKVQGVETITANDLEHVKPKGGGGTDFKPGFEYIEQEGLNPIATLYFTDGYCNSFPEPPDFPHLWILTDKLEKWDPPFGETIILEGE